MRVSTDQSDPGFTGPLGVQIFLNDTIVKHVITADEELGIVVVHKHDCEGKPLFNPLTKAMEQQELRGTVRIDLDADHRLRAAWQHKKRLASLNAPTPLPATSYVLATGGSLTYTPAWNEQQVRAYAKAEAERATKLERERCAQLVEDMERECSPWECAQEIRSPVADAQGLTNPHPYGKESER